MGYESLGSDAALECGAYGADHDLHKALAPNGPRFLGDGESRVPKPDPMAMLRVLYNAIIEAAGPQSAGAASLSPIILALESERAEVDARIRFAVDVEHHRNMDRDAKIRATLHAMRSGQYMTMAKGVYAAIALLDGEKL